MAEIGTDQLLQFAGRLHPLVLHMPIGFAVALVLLEVLFLARRKPMAREIRAPLTWLTALSAAFAIASGLILHEEGGYNAETVQLHQWLGIAVGACCLVAAVAQQAKRQGLYALALGAGAVLLIPAGHFGATMTHGENFLLEPFAPAREPIVMAIARPPEEVSEYAGVIAPILQARCAGCHGAERDKGGLRLHTPEAILAGGEMGPVLVAGNAAASDMVRRLRLPPDDDDHMPPKSKTQLSDEEIAAIEAWIAGGAAFDAAPAPPAVDRASGPAGGEPGNAVETPGRPDPAAIAAIRGRLAHVEPIARDSGLCLVDFSAVASGTDDALLRELLEPLREHVADLNLARTGISDECLAFVASMPNLRRLNLASTAVTERGVGFLASHATLEELVLTGTSLTDSAFDALTALPSLKQLYLWKSGITPETIAELRGELPGVAIDAGDTPDAVVIATQGEAAPAVSAAEILRPVNTMCPVANKPVDPAFAIVHKGRVIGFCCRHCVASFLEEPEKYEGKVGE